MIAKRLGSAVAFSRRADRNVPVSLVCPASLQVSPSARTVVSSSNEHSLHSSASSSSSPSSYPMSAFRPSMPAYAKRRTSPKTQEMNEAAEEEEEDNDDDGDLFAISSSDAELPSSLDRAAASSQRRVAETVSFQQAMAELQEKIQTIEEVGLQAEVSLSNTDWTKLLAAATTVTNLKTCLHIGRQWRNLAYHYKGGIPDFNTSQAKSFVARCEQLNCPELALYAMGARANYGLDIDLRLARRVQMCLVNKLMTVKKNREKLFRDSLVEEAVWKVKASEFEEEVPAEAGEEGEGQAAAEAGHAKPKKIGGKRILEMRHVERKLQLVDHTMALAEMTRLFRESRGSGGKGPDHVSLLLSLRGMIDAFKVNSGPAYNRDIVARIKTSLRILSSTEISAKDGQEDTHYTSEEALWLRHASNVVGKAVSMHEKAWFLSDTRGVVRNIDAVLSQTFTQCEAARVRAPPQLAQGVTSTNNDTITKASVTA